MAASAIRRRVWVSGKVQGVGFRASTLNEASRYPGLSGFVRNLPDGRVEAVFQGEEASVLAMVAWCGKGPPFSAVSGLEVKEESVDSALSGAFEIKRGA